MSTRTQLKAFFETGDVPTQSQFGDLIDSLAHLTEDFGTGVATFLATPSSANLAAAVTDETGSGAVVFANTPTLVTPVLGVASATTINKVTLTAPATGCTVTIVDGKTFTCSNTLTLAGTDGSTLNVGTGGTLGTAAFTAATAYQPVDADLTTISGLTATTDSFLQAKSSAWAARTIAQVKTDLGLTGTNSGDQTITLQGDVTGTGTGTFTTTIAAGSVDIAMLSATGTPSSATFLRGDNTWSTPSATVEGTAVLSTGEVGGSKFLREDGDGTCSWQTISGGGDALTSSPLSQFAATTSSQLAGVISDETGSGALVFATSPTLVTPTLGVAAATTINKVALTAPATGSTLTIADGQTLTVNGSATITNGTHSGTNTGDQTTVTGNAGTVTVADAGGDSTTWVLLGTAQTGSLAPATDAGITYDASTNALTTTTFVGALTGHASLDLALTGGTLTGTVHHTNTTNTISANAVTVNWQSGNYQTLDMSASTGAVTVTFTAPSASPCTLILKLTQDAGPNDITWPAGVKWDDDGEPTWSGDTSKTRIVSFFYDGTNYWAIPSGTFT